jgi:hypothetical protein
MNNNNLFFKKDQKFSSNRYELLINKKNYSSIKKLFWWSSLLFIGKFGVDVTFSYYNYKLIHDNKISSEVWNNFGENALEVLQDSKTKELFGNNIQIIEKIRIDKIPIFKLFYFSYGISPHSEYFFRLKTIFYSSLIKIYLPIEGSKGKGNLLMEIIADKGKWYLKQIGIKKGDYNDVKIIKTYYEALDSNQIPFFVEKSFSLTDIIKK